MPIKNNNSTTKEEKKQSTVQPQGYTDKTSLTDNISSIDCYLLAETSASVEHASRNNSSKKLSPGKFERIIYAFKKLPVLHEILKAHNYQAEKVLGAQLVKAIPLEWYKNIVFESKITWYFSEVSKTWVEVNTEDLAFYIREIIRKYFENLFGLVDESTRQIDLPLEDLETTAFILCTIMLNTSNTALCNTFKENEELFKNNFQELLDSNKEELPFKNGILNVRTGEILPHGPERYITCYINRDFEYIQEYKPLMQFINDIFPIEEERDYFLRTVAHSLFSNIKIEEIYFMLGAGSNGKTLFLQLLIKAINPFITNVKPQLFTSIAGSTQSADPEIYKLKVARIATCSEPTNKAMPSHIIKRLVGNDSVSARPLFGHPVTFTLSTKFFVASNNPPEFADPDEAMWRRIRYIYFRTIFTDDPKLPSHKKADHSLNLKIMEPIWCNALISLLMDLYRKDVENNVLSVPPPTTMKTFWNEEKEIQVNISEWINEKFIYDPNQQEVITLDRVIKYFIYNVFNINIFADADYKNFNFYRYTNKNLQGFKTQIIGAVKLSPNQDISLKGAYRVHYVKSQQKRGFKFVTLKGEPKLYSP
ncbi:putative DNA primase/helicase [Nematocida ausubeli]|nr:putative DNA primase/helicase [Nematocida ausubeli]